MQNFGVGNGNFRMQNNSAGVFSVGGGGGSGSNNGTSGGGGGGGTNSSTVVSLKSVRVTGSDYTVTSDDIRYMILLLDAVNIPTITVYLPTPSLTTMFHLINDSNNFDNNNNATAFVKYRNINNQLNDVVSVDNEAGIRLLYHKETDTWLTF